MSLAQRAKAVLTAPVLMWQKTTDEKSFARHGEQWPGHGHSEQSLFKNGVNCFHPSHFQQGLCHF